MYVCMYVLAWSAIAQSVCQRAFSLLAIWCLGSRVQILLSAEEHNMSPFDLNIACLCQSIENNNKYVCMYVCIYIYTKFVCYAKIENVNYAQPTGFICDSRMEVLEKVSKFLRLKTPRPSWNPNLRTHAECFYHSSYRCIWNSQNLNHNWIPNYAAVSLHIYIYINMNIE